MREIKFRAQIIESPTWVYGYYFYSYRHNKHYIIGDAIDYGYSQGDMLIYIRQEEVKPETVGEYTGLNDKNGKNIYEGDIVKATGIDYFGNEISPIFEVKRICDEYNLFHEFDFTKPTFEVIGNIYEKPELLKDAEVK